MLSLSLSLASLVGSPLTFISSLQRAPLFTKVYGAPPLPSAGVCQMSPDVGNSIGLHDVPFYLQQAPAECRAPVSYILVRRAQTHTLGRVSRICMLWTRGLWVIILGPNLILQRAYKRPSWGVAGRRVGLNKQQRGVACAWQRWAPAVRCLWGTAGCTPTYKHAHNCGNEGRPSRSLPLFLLLASVPSAVV